MKIFNIHCLKGEREAKYALKKELDQRINNESVYNLSNLAFSIRGVYIFKYILIDCIDYF